MTSSIFSLGSFFSSSLDAGDIFIEFTKNISPKTNEIIKRIIQTGLFLNIEEISI